MSDELKTEAPMANDPIPHEAPAGEPTPLFDPGCRSSIFEKTTPELRRKLDRAILNYDPASYLAIFKKYQLATVGISYTAFYYYARKLRGQAALRQFVDHACADEDALCKSLPHLLGQFIVEHLMASDKAGPESIYRLTLAYAASKNAGAQHDRTAAYRERTEVQRQHNERRDETARANAETARTRADAQLRRAKNAPSHPQTRDDPDDPLAPWGRKENGDAYTQEEFNQSLNQAIKDIWGLPPVNPNSRMPDGWNKSRDTVEERTSPDDANPENPFESPGESPIRFRKMSAESANPFVRPPRSSVEAPGAGPDRPP